MCSLWVARVAAAGSDSDAAGDVWAANHRPVRQGHFIWARWISGGDSIFRKCLDIRRRIFYNSAMQKQTQCGEADVIKRVTVRLVREEERGEFDFRLEDQHYLQSARLAGQTLRYVAELDGAWVALLCFGAAALHLKGESMGAKLSWAVEAQWVTIVLVFLFDHFDHSVACSPFSRTGGLSVVSCFPSACSSGHGGVLCFPPGD